MGQKCVTNSSEMSEKVWAVQVPFLIKYKYILGSQIKYCLFWDLSSPLRPLETNTWRSLFELEILGLWLLSSVLACGGRMLMKSSSSISTNFYDITCKGFFNMIWRVFFWKFRKKRSSQLLQVSLKTKATYSKANVQKKFIGIFGIKNQKL